MLADVGLNSSGYQIFSPTREFHRRVSQSKERECEFFDEPSEKGDLGRRFFPGDLSEKISSGVRREKNILLGGLWGEKVREPLP